MIIQWYPGHMTKAIRMMEKEMKIMDAVIYVLDARAPFSCVNPKFTKLINNKPFIYVLNKYDLADPVSTKEWFDYFSKKGSSCVMLNSTQSGSAKKIQQALLQILNQKITRLAEKNITANIRAMVLGVPNSGKSTLINNLSGKSKTVTGNRPGVTRGKQWVHVTSGIDVLDTPGTLWPAFDNNHVAKHLAYIGSIKEDVLDIPNLALEFISDIRAINSTVLATRYDIKIEENDTSLTVLENICKSRHYLLKGGDIDYDRGAFALINDFRQGKLGNITLETVKDINKLLVNHRMSEENAK